MPFEINATVRDGSIQPIENNNCPRCSSMRINFWLGRELLTIQPYSVYIQLYSFAIAMIYSTTSVKVIDTRSIKDK